MYFEGISWDACKPFFEKVGDSKRVEFFEKRSKNILNVLDQDQQLNEEKNPDFDSQEIHPPEFVKAR